MIFVYTTISVLLVSACSLVGLVALSFTRRFAGIVPLLVSISVGALLGDAFIHLIPETLTEGDPLLGPLFVIAGILGFFIFEHALHWHHHTTTHEGRHDVETIHVDQQTRSVKTTGLVILTSDALHNALDGLIIAASFMADLRLGIATTIAIILHEIPQELGDFGVLLHAGYTERQALKANILSALCAFLGAFIGLLIAGASETILAAMLPLAAGGFIYIATADLIPELHKTRDRRIALLQFLGVLAGIVAMLLLRIFAE
jgi:zinc and cadmium transporter